MGRTAVKVTTQKTDASCGPASIKHALEIFGLKKSERTLQKLCKTTRNGTSTLNMISALKRLGYAVMAIEHATLRHITGALKYSPLKPRAVIVSYLYESDNAKSSADVDSGHWATVYTYRANKSRIVLFDSYTGTKKSYVWSTFTSIWKDYDRVRKTFSGRSKRIKLIRKWQHKLMLIVAKDVHHLPNFHSPYIRVYS